MKIMADVAVDFIGYSRIFNVIYSLAGVVSLAGALLIEKYGQTELVFVANAISFAVSFGFLRGLAYRHDPGAIDKTDGFKRWAEGFKMLKRHPILLYSIGFVVLVDFFTGVLYVEFPQKAAIVGLGSFGTYIYYFMVCSGNTVGALFIGSGRRSAASLEARSWGG